jgi:diaminopimelate decarboxylase
LRELEGTLPVRHWLSLKTHPVAPLLRAWRDEGRGVEVVSEFELRAALTEGIKPERILVNGVAKHAWLTRHAIDGLRVHLDSFAEIAGLADLARRCRWRLGLRCHVTPERDAEDPQFLDQFGFMPDEAVDAIGALRARGCEVDGLHFHLRTNVRTVDDYRQALADISCLCRKARLVPHYVDCGGGLPVTSEHTYDQPADAVDLDLNELRAALDAFAEDVPGVREIWFENGRFVTSDSAVLVVRVLDVKDRPDCRYLVCDGGRTNQALVSAWESHQFMTVPERHGPPRLTTVCGPTCMSWDWIIRAAVADDVAIGDCIVWLNAGAYHVPWESRLSNGLSPVVWCDHRSALTIAREREDFERWWGSWK